MKFVPRAGAAPRVSGRARPEWAVYPARALDRAPERLVLEGFRRWSSGYETGDLRHWQAAWDMHALALGPGPAREVVDRLARFVATVRAFALCPLRCPRGACPLLCREECFALGMVAASQHGDVEALAASMRHLLTEDGHEAAMLPTLAYAEALAERELTLQTVPRDLIETFGARPAAALLH